MGKKLTILVPVYNERSTVERLLSAVEGAPACGLEKEIIVVDDGSTDGTVEILERLEHERRFTLLRHARNLGKGAAIRTALARASGDLVLIQDADLEYDPGDYPALLAAFSDQSPVVYGSRNL